MNNLQLKIVLSMADKLTAPLRNAMRGSKELAAALGKTKDEVKTLERVQNQLARFNSMRLDGGNMNKSIDEQNEKIKERLGKLRGLGTESRRLRGLIKAEEKNMQAWVLTSKTLGTKAGKRASSNYREEFLYHAEQAEKSRMHLASLNMELDKVVKEEKKLGHEKNMATKEIGKLEAARRNLAERLRETKKLLKENGVNTRQLGSEEARLAASLGTTNSRLAEQRAQMEKIAAVQKRMDISRAAYNKTKELQGRLAGTGATMIATGGTMASPVIAAVKQYADFEDAMKGVAKQVNGARDDNGKLTSTYYDMAKAIKAISERLPSESGAIDIAALVEGAARMGIQGKDNLLAFAETSAKAAKAFELPAGDLAENMGKIANLYKIPIKDIERLGDTINWLDDNAQSKGSDIIDVLQRMGGVADKLDYKKAAALGSTFLSLGAQSETAATASIAMVRELSIATMQSKRFQEGMGTLGLSSEKMEKSMGKDAMGTIITVLEQIKKLPKDAQMRVTTQLFGKEYGKDAAKLANNLDELHKQLKLVNDEKARGSMQRESDIDADSISAQWTLLKTGIANTFSGLGETLRSPLMDILGKIKQITIATRQWVEEHPQLTGNILKALAAVSAITVTVGALGLGIAAILGPIALAKFSLSTLGIKILPGLGAALVGTGGGLRKFVRLLQSTRAGGLAAEWAATKNAIAGSESPLVKMWGQIKRNRGGLYQLIDAYVAAKQVMSKSLTGVMSGMASGMASVMASVKNNPLQSLIKGAGSAGREMLWLASSPIRALIEAGSRLISTVLWLGRLFLLNPVGLFVTAVAVGAMLIFKYWEPVKAFIGGVIDGFSAAIEPIKSLFTPLKPIFTAIGNGLKWVFNLFGDLLSPVKSTSAELSGAAEMGRKFGEWLANGVNIALAPLKLLIDGIKWVLDNLPKMDAKIEVPENFKPGAAMPWMQPAAAGGPNFMATMKPVTMPKQTVHSSVVHAPITVVAQPGQDEKALAAVVKKHVEEAQRSASKQARGSLSYEK